MENIYRELKDSSSNGLVKQVSMRSFTKQNLLGQINFDTGDLINLINQLLMKTANQFLSSFKQRHGF